MRRRNQASFIDPTAQLGQSFALWRPKLLPESGSGAPRAGAELRTALEQDEAREGSSLLGPRLSGRLEGTQQGHGERAERPPPLHPHPHPGSCSKKAFRRL